MTIMEMMRQSGVLTILGVGTVFLFLVLMVICVALMGKIVRALGLDNVMQTPTAKDGPVGKTTANYGATVAAITAAVNEYKKPQGS